MCVGNENVFDDAFSVFHIMTNNLLYLQQKEIIVTNNHPSGEFPVKIIQCLFMISR